jgi:phenylacetate-CoA ligase
MQGSPLRNDLLDIRNKLSSGQHTDKLERLLKHATLTTTFYERFAGQTSINAFPVIDKNLIRENLNSFISKKATIGELIPVVTSGSTGTPFKVFHNKRKKIRNSADTIYFSGLTGFEVGQKLMYLKIWAKEKMASPFAYWKQNLVPIDVIHLSDQQIEQMIAQMEKRSSVHGILGYVSALELVCRYLEKSGRLRVNANVSSIITMSEALSEYVKSSMRNFFGAHVYARYSNLENGIIAQQVPGSDDRLLINSASYHVEILELNSNSAVLDGTVGRIVVTDLYNEAMPLIRYDTGDLGSFSNATDKFGNRFLETVEGRKLDVLYDTRGNIISSYIMYKNMWKYTEIKQYQLIQKDSTRYILKVNAEEGFDKHEQLITEFKKYLGDDADFKIERVDEIPLLNSGKRRKLVNEMVQKTNV